MKKKSSVTKRNPGGQVPKPATDHQQVRKRQMKNKTPKVLPVRNFST